MKQKTFLFALLLVTISFVSCKKDSEDIQSISLKGTTWKLTIVESGVTKTSTLYFTDDTNAKLTETSSEGGIQEVTILFTYKYTHPKIVLYMEELPVETFTVVDDNTISVTEDGVTLNYKKQ